MSTRTLRETPIHVGIDLGTTYSSIAIYSENNNNQVEVLEISNNVSSIPSWVQLLNRGNGIKTYQAGILAKKSGGICLHDSKRLIGETVKHYNEQKKLLPSFTSFAVSTDNNEIKMCVEDPTNPTQTESFYPIEVSAMVLRTLYNVLKEKIGNKKIGKVVVTIPVSFTPKQKKETIQACKMAGFEDISLLHEPTASVIEFDREHHIKDNSKVLVIDCGGGTTDVACCIFHKDEKKENHGKDLEITKKIVLEKIKHSNIANEKVLELLNPPEESDSFIIKLGKQSVSERIDGIVLNCLKRVSQGNSFTFNGFEIHRELKMKIAIKPEDFNKRDEDSKIECIRNESDLNLGGNNFDDSLITIILDKIKQRIGDTEFQRLFIVKSADAKNVKKKKEKRMKKIRNIAEDTKILFSGNTGCLPIQLDDLNAEDLEGATITVTRDEFESECIKDKLIEKIERCVKNVIKSADWAIEDIDCVLAVGGTCYIPLVRKSISKMLGEIKLAYQLSINKEDTVVEVMPYTLGFGLVDNKFSIFAPKGEPLPITYEGEYFNAYDDQRSIRNSIYKGEGRKTNEEGMELVTEVTIEGLPPGLKEGEFKMIHKVTVNKSGLVEVETVKKETGKHLEKMKAFVNLGFDEDMIKKIQQHLEPYIRNSE
ncbi:heat shock protein 70kD, putative [Entamoeba dispar SAW760]|uniref:Heat shock protein 70kD, putative n=1 Tax=Entamoeba dispar (strain ATCC PRA-260 / SAW760) TaxID=370354 RepID=B0ERG9_ENTDS|nr:heat shock protein 70kD, putative [Entamoeba dispar SAW760]EDR22869.1 heat shock protein 70kD, putative [Entamoeba dispar SAW760]|eukprot:EDR22869.1 heat shock protein 70kD, putative [Entamoeba dispar SAW760]